MHRAPSVMSKMWSLPSAAASLLQPSPLALPASRGCPARKALFAVHPPQMAPKHVVPGEAGWAVWVSWMTLLTAIMWLALIRAITSTGALQLAGTPTDPSPDSSPAPVARTVDDIRGTRCFNRWPYRYFGQHTEAKDVLDPHDSIYPRAATRLGPKYQAAPPSWEEQLELGLGVQGRSSDDVEGSAAVNGLFAEDGGGAAPKKKGGRPPKRKRPEVDRSDTPQALTTPTMNPVKLPAEAPVKDLERGTDESIEVIWQPQLKPGKIGE